MTHSRRNVVGLFLVLFFWNANLPTFANEDLTNTDFLTIHFTHSPRGVKWNSPNALAASVLRNTIAPVKGSRHSIGHVRVELKCGDTYLMTGMTNEFGRDTTDAVLKEGYGLGVVLRTYRGKLEVTDEVLPKQQELLKTGRASFVKFFINPTTCDRLVQYLKEYKENGYDKMYSGLHAFPLNRQGSGCSAFGASFLELSGLQIPEFEEKWMRHDIILPHRFIGDPEQGKKVNFFRVLFAIRSSWGETDDDGVRISFWDPDRMHRWTKRTYLEAAQGSFESSRFPWPLMGLEKIGKGRGLIFDARSVATPSGPIFKN